MSTRLGGTAARSGTTVVPDLTHDAVAQLGEATGHPCISVLMPTIVAPRMLAEDRARLDRLQREVEHRLAGEGSDGHEVLLRELRRHVRLAQGSRTGHALGIFVSHRLSRAWSLPVSVREKAVVEPTFATRDLLRALHRTPPHLVVRVDDLGARVFWVAGHVTLVESVERLAPGRPWGVAPAATGGADPMADRDELIARIDACLTRVREERPAPLVLAGDLALVSALKAGPGRLARLAGEVVGARAADPDELFAASALCVQEYLERRGRQALDELLEATLDAPDRVVAGLQACWAAVADGEPGTLLVEHGYVHPEPAGEERPVACHDVVDDLIEIAIEAGNLIAFVEDAELHAFGGIALLRHE